MVEHVASVSAPAARWSCADRTARARRRCCASWRACSRRCPGGCRHAPEAVAYAGHADGVKADADGRREPALLGRPLRHRRRRRGARRLRPRTPARPPRRRTSRPGSGAASAWRGSRSTAGRSGPRRADGLARRRLGRALRRRRPRASRRRRPRRRSPPTSTSASRPRPRPVAVRRPRTAWAASTRPSHERAHPPRPAPRRPRRRRLRPVAGLLPDRHRAGPLRRRARRARPPRGIAPRHPLGRRAPRHAPLARPACSRSTTRTGRSTLLATSPLPLEALALAKAAAHWLTTGLPLTLAAPLFGLLLGLPRRGQPWLVLTLALGTPALSVIGTFGAALTVGLRRGGLLLSLLVLPLYVPDADLRGRGRAARRRGAARRHPAPAARGHHARRASRCCPSPARRRCAINLR